MYPPQLQGHPDRAGEILLPFVRDDHPAPFHPIARGRAGPNLLATVLHAKFGGHLPLNRQSEGLPARVSTSASRPGRLGGSLHQRAIAVADGASPARAVG